MIDRKPLNSTFSFLPFRSLQWGITACVTLLVVFYLSVGLLHAQTISTAAGDGRKGYGGDGGSATGAQLYNPVAVATDLAGNFYISDQINCVIRKVSVATGKISTVVGNHAGANLGCGYTGDGTPATSTELSYPLGVAVDIAGNIYISDTGNYRVRKVTVSTGIISTVAGNGKLGFSGDGGPATSAELSNPDGIAVDGVGNIYIGDWINRAVRKVTVSTGRIETVAGRGSGCPGETDPEGDGCPATSAELQEPQGLAVDSAGNLYIADAKGSRVRRISRATGIITTVAGNGRYGFGGDGGPATSAELMAPSGVAVDGSGSLYIADVNDQAVRKVTASTGIIKTVAGDGQPGYSGDGGPATHARLESPYGVAADLSYNLYIADTGNERIRKVTSTGRTATTTTLVSSANPSNAGMPVTFTATVSPTGSPLPTGTVAFFENGTLIAKCSAISLSSGHTAACTTDTLPPGTNSISAVYWGDGAYEGSAARYSQIVNRLASSTTLTPNVNPSIAGQSVIFTAVVAPAGPPVPTGTVSFTANGASIAPCSAVSITSSRTAACSTAALVTGSYTINAMYSGDGNYLPSSGSLSQTVNATATPGQFVAVTPCRAIDTRLANGPFGGPAIAGGTFRSFTIPAGPCKGIPANAAAYSLNVTVVPPGPLSYLTVWPAGDTQPLASVLNSLDGRIKANAEIVPAGKSGAINVYASDTTNLLLDINGYFEAGGSGTLEFYPLTPCRIVDTRKAAGPLGGPSLIANVERDFPVLLSACQIPDAAKAYSLNVTAVPKDGGALGYLTVWPQGQARPLVSTLNDLTATIVANAAIVPSGSGGGVAVYPSNATDMVIDVNGYFASPVPGGLSYYSVVPCRVLDTRKTTGVFSGERTVMVSASPCAPPHSAQAYVFNATVVPSGPLGYLSLWPDGEPQPAVSTLNALDGAITSNLAIVPTTNGRIDAYASGTTQLVLDISAYFAP